MKRQAKILVVVDLNDRYFAPMRCRAHSYFSINCRPARIMPSKSMNRFSGRSDS
jgi:hypothetical protein